MMWRKRKLSTLLMGMQTGANTVESSMEIPQEIKTGSAFWPSNPANGNLSKGTQNTTLKEQKHPYVHCSVIYNHQDVEAAQVSISRWVDKTTMGRLHNGILLGHKKEENFTLCNSTDLKNIMLSEISQSEKYKHHVISLLCGIQWTNWTQQGK